MFTCCKLQEFTTSPPPVMCLLGSLPAAFSVDLAQKASQTTMCAEGVHMPVAFAPALPAMMPVVLQPALCAIPVVMVGLPMVPQNLVANQLIPRVEPGRAVDEHASDDSSSTTSSITESPLLGKVWQLSQRRSVLWTLQGILRRPTYVPLAHGTAS